MLSAEGTGGLVVLSGPSCVGKSPLAKALRRFHPDLSAKLQPIVLYNSRSPRPGERDGEDYHFRPREQIEALRDRERYVVMDVRGDLQALDLEDLSALLNKGDASPLSREEILFLRDEAHVSLPDLVAEVMRRKLLRRAHRQKTDLSLKDLEEIERRAGSAYRELKEAHHFEYVIPNHDGEDSDNWEAFYYPLGDARRAFLAIMALLRGEGSEAVEKWEEDLLP